MVVGAKLFIFPPRAVMSSSLRKGIVDENSENGFRSYGVGWREREAPADICRGSIMLKLIRGMQICAVAFAHFFRSKD